MKVMRLWLNLFLATQCFFLEAGAGDEGFTFYDFFQGEWDVHRSTVYMKISEQHFDELTGHYTIAKEADTGNLVGRYFQNGTTGEITNAFDLEVDFTEPNSGVFKTGASEFNMKTLFTFDFTRQPNGILLAHGEWLGEMEAYYQFQCNTWETFVITVYPKYPQKKTQGGVGMERAMDEDDEEEFELPPAPPPMEEDEAFADYDEEKVGVEAILYLGKKKSTTAKSGGLFQSYTWLILVGIIILNTFIFPGAKKDAKKD